MPTLQPRLQSLGETDDELSEPEQIKEGGVSSGDELEASEDESEYALTFDLPGKFQFIGFDSLVTVRCSSFVLVACLSSQTAAKGSEKITSHVAD